MDVERRPGVFVFVRLPAGEATRWLADAAATVREDEGTTLVLERAAAERAHLPFEFEAAWLTVRAETSLSAVGITARLSRALADAGIAANVIAAYTHDHVLVPIGDADRAVAALAAVP
jgi:uncharacterized protein